MSGMSEIRLVICVSHHPGSPDPKTAYAHRHVLSPGQALPEAPVVVVQKEREPINELQQRANIEAKKMGFRLLNP